MHAFERVSTGAAVAAMLCCGCAPDSSRGEVVGEAAGAEIVPNGLNFNGLNFNGVHLAPLPLAGLRLGGHANPNAHVISSVLAGGPGSSSMLVGAELPGTLSNGASLTLRIDAVTTPASQPDLPLFTVSYQLTGSVERRPLCGLAADGTPVQAIPLSGSWDESAGTPTGGAHLDDPMSITFACRGYALAKCVEFGYAPWRSVTECRAPGDCHQLSLAPFHQACTRMLRADYCGDGTSTTRDGTLIDVWDEPGLQTDDAATWAFEGEWGEGGASCVVSTRWPTVTSGGETVSRYIQDHCQSRWKAPGCGGPGSPFFTTNGFSTPLDARPLLRSRITHPNG